MKQLATGALTDLKDELKRNPNHWIDIVRGFTIIMVVMFMTPQTVAVVHNPTSNARDVLIIWNQDDKLVTDTLRLLKGLVPTFSVDDDYPYPPTSRNSLSPPLLPGAQP